MQQQTKHQIIIPLSPEYSLHKQLSAEYLQQDLYIKGIRQKVWKKLKQVLSWQVNYNYFPINDISDLANELVVSFKNAAFSDEELLTVVADFNVCWLGKQQPIKSDLAKFTAPIGKEEMEDLRWYIESYYQWPSGVFKQRAERIEQNLPKWGAQLLAAISADKPMIAWFADKRPKQLTIEVESQVTQMASSVLLRLPWELLFSEDIGYWFDKNCNVVIRRRIKQHALHAPSQQWQAQPVKLPLRILLVSPRPEVSDDGRPVGLLDHRISAKALLAATKRLGKELVDFEILYPATFEQLKIRLKQAQDQGTPFDVVHFDGHGVYDSNVDVGCLCFERETQKQNMRQKAILDLVDATDLGVALDEFGISLMMLDACQTAMSENDPHASVAAQLLQAGIGAVVAMNYSVLVETARGFVQAFYLSLAQGKTIGEAVINGQQALFTDDYRLLIMGAGKLHLKDWFVPVLYQERKDSRLLNIAHKEIKLKTVKDNQQRFAALPTFAHQFIGRSRDLLQLERHLYHHPYASIIAGGGFGKTALACELCHWLVTTKRFAQVIFVSVEPYNARNLKGILQTIGEQCIPNFLAAEHGDKAKPIVIEALKAKPSLLLFDNLESVLDAPHFVAKADYQPSESIAELMSFWQELIEQCPNSRLLFTSRETLPAPFNNRDNLFELGALHKTEAIELVEKVMAIEGWLPPENDDATTPQQIDSLVNAVNCHPRALVLIAREIAKNQGANFDGGVVYAQQQITAIMEKLDKLNPNDRENSLFASIELSLRRLPEGVLEQIKPLAVLQGGGNIWTLSQLLDIEANKTKYLVNLLQNTGLVRLLEHGYLQFDPALTKYLKCKAEINEELITLWSLAIKALLNFLYEQKFQDSKLAAQLIVLEQANISALLAYLLVNLEVFKKDDDIETFFKLNWSIESICKCASLVEALIKEIDGFGLYQQAVKLRSVAGHLLTTSCSSWSKTMFSNIRAEILQLEQKGDFRAAKELAQYLMSQAISAGDNAYEGAAFHIALSKFDMSQILILMEEPKASLKLAQEAEQGFVKCLEQNGSISAKRMASSCVVLQGDCLRTLGLVQDSVDRYIKANDISRALDDKRALAVGLGQLASSYILLAQYSKAIEHFNQSLKVFAELNEPRTIAGIHYQLAQVYLEINEHHNAEDSLSYALGLFTQLKDIKWQGNCLNALGNLYHSIAHYEVSFNCYEKAFEMCDQVGGDPIETARMTNNLANILFKLERYEKAKIYVERTIDLKLTLENVEIWKSYCILSNIEYALGDYVEAKSAWRQAVETYYVDRKQGLHSELPSARMAEYFQGEIDKAFNSVSSQQELTRNYHGLEELIKNKQTMSEGKLMANKLQLILKGERGDDLWNDVELPFDCAVEIRLILETLEGDEIPPEI